MREVYLDNNATTMVDPAVVEEMLPFYSEKYGNPNSLHRFALTVHPPMRNAYDIIYGKLGANDSDTIVINSCASEGNNTVFKGIFFSQIYKKKKNHIVTSYVEHPSIISSVDFLTELGVEVTRLLPNRDGIIDADELNDAIRDDTALVSIMWANNETGLINPVARLATVCRQKNVPFHVDAVQAIGKHQVNLRQADVDFATFSAHKFHGPKGVGGLYIRNGVDLPPFIHGGEQMAGLRAGTVNVAGMVGMAKALELATDDLPGKIASIKKLRDKLEDAILSLPDTLVIGDRKLRTPNTILASFSGIEGEAFLWDINKQGIAASTGSACSSESLQSNQTMSVIGIDESLAHTGIRFSLSRFTTERDVDYSIEVIKKAVERLRKISTDKRGKTV